MNWTTSAFLSLLFLGVFGPESSEQHARLLEPPSRASMWRVGFPNPRDEDDNQGYCGGFGVQYHKNNGKCGICGDRWDDEPRQHEAPHGIFANGLITRRYKQGYIIPVVVDVTANHNGHFEFKLCPNDNIFKDPSQECFDQFPLRTSEGYKYPIFGSDGIGYQQLYVELPLTVTCEQCILQWTYVAGNNWGTCDNGTSGIGCGPQEHFRSCADIQIQARPLLTQILKSSGNSSPDLNAKEDLGFDRNVFAEDQEAALRRKKLYLQAILAKVKEMILVTEQSESKNEQVLGMEKGLEKMREEELQQKIFAPANDHQNDLDYGQEDADLAHWDDGDPNPWWAKIISNKH